MFLIIFFFCIVEEVVPVVLDAIHVTTTVGMIEDTTGVATIAMTTGTTTDHTGDISRLSTKPEIEIGK